MTTPTTEGSLISRAKAAAQAAVGDARDELIEISREIHANPELAMEEKRASGLLARRLEQRGFAVERGAFGLETAFRARWGEAPETGINALDGLVTAYQAIAQLRQHMRRDARVAGIITYGGSAHNVVPDRAEGRFEVRALRPAYLADLKARVIRCFEAGAQASG